MNAGWQFVLNQTSVHFLMSLRGRNRTHLIDRLERLAADPTQSGDFGTKDDTGRSIQIKAAGPFLISFWADPWAKELRVINIEWI